jgi:hypothetical protein
MTGPGRSPFQYSLRTLLLLFVVAASSLGVFGAWGILHFALAVGLAVYLCEAKALWPLGYLMLILLGFVAMIGIFLAARVKSAQEEVHYGNCLNQIKQLLLTVSNYYYYAGGGNFPPAYTVDKNGNRLHSWRTLVLRYMEYGPLYKSFDLTKPWDAPEHKTQVATPLREFVCPDDRNAYAAGAAQTNYFAVVGPNSAWDQSRHVASTGEEASHTIMLVEVADSGIAWAEPRDVSLETLSVTDARGQGRPISSNHHPPDEFFYTYDHVSGTVVAMADGSVHFLRTDNLSRDELRKILQIGGCTDEVLAAQGNFYSGRRLHWPNIVALAVWLISVGTLLTAAVRGRKARFAPAEVAAPP